MDMLEDKIRKVLKIVKELILMEILIGDDEDFYLGDFIEDKNVEVFEEVAFGLGLIGVISDILDSFIEWEVKVI